MSTEIILKLTIGEAQTLRTGFTLGEDRLLSEKGNATNISHLLHQINDIKAMLPNIQ